MRNILIAIFLIFALFWVASILPISIANNAKNSFKNIAGKETGIDINLFRGPTKRRYNLYRWYYLPKDNDSLYIDVEVDFLLFGSRDKIYYSSSSGKKNIYDFPKEESDE